MDTSQLFFVTNNPVDTRPLTCGSSAKRGRSLKKKPGVHRRSTSTGHSGSITHCSGPIQRANRLKLQNPREECTSMFPQILWKRQQAVGQRSPLKKKDSFSCRQYFPVFSRAELEWLYHFRSRDRHFDSYAHIIDKKNQSRSSLLT